MTENERIPLEVGPESAPAPGPVPAPAPAPADDDQPLSLRVWYFIICLGLLSLIIWLGVEVHRNPSTIKEGDFFRPLPDEVCRRSVVGGKETCLDQCGCGWCFYNKSLSTCLGTDQGDRCEDDGGFWSFVKSQECIATWRRANDVVFNQWFGLVLFCVALCVINVRRCQLFRRRVDRALSTGRTPPPMRECLIV